MHRIYYALIFIDFLWILTVDCQGGRGRGGGGGGRSRSRGSSGSTIDCKTEECKRNFIIISVGVFLTVFSCVATALICVHVHCRRRRSNGKSSADNATFVRLNRQGDPEECRQQQVPMLNVINSDHHKIFRSGMWSSRYYQYGKWNGPFEFILSFDPQTWQLRGGGWDNIGKFNIFGHYSTETFRMGITKTYIRGTGDQSQNLGHDVNIQLTANTRTEIFEGKWYVNTNRYSGDDKFELQFVRNCQYYDNV